MRERAATPDPYRTLIIERGLLLRELGPGKDAITCPFAAEHSEVTSDTSSVYLWPLHGGYKWGHIDCKHGHCAGRKQEDFIRALGMEPQEVWRGQGRLGAPSSAKPGSGPAPYDDLPPVEAYDEAAQEDTRRRTAGVKASGGSEYGSG